MHEHTGPIARLSAVRMQTDSYAKHALYPWFFPGRNKVEGISLRSKVDFGQFSNSKQNDEILKAVAVVHISANVV